MKIAIVAYSHHHENTNKLIDAIAQKHEIVRIDALTQPDADLSAYDLIGFASGIYYSKFHKSVLKMAEERLPRGKKVFFLYTYGMKKEGYTRSIREAVEKKGAKIAGEYGCLGLNTFGPFKLIGGMAKGHPDETELREAVAFFESCLR